MHTIPTTSVNVKAYGTHDYKEISIEGRVQFDLMIAIQREHKLASYRWGLAFAARMWVAAHGSPMP